MMSGLVRRRLPFAQTPALGLSLRSPLAQAGRGLTSRPSASGWTRFVSVFAGVRNATSLQATGRSSPRSIRPNGIIGIGASSLLLNDRRIPRSQDALPGGLITLQVKTALFHTSRPNQGLPIVWLATFLKSSTALAFAQTAGRVTMSLLPVLFLKLKWVSKFLRRATEDHPHYAHFAHKREKVLRVRWRLWTAVAVLVTVPLALFVSTILASLERTPLTGRMRLIMLSAEEEEEIARELKGAGWYTSVARILVTASPDGAMPRVIPPDDWRWNWVEQTLRLLEAAIPKLQERAENPSAWYTSWANDHPHVKSDGATGVDWEVHGLVPPPLEYPLIPRPRVAQLLHEIPISPDADGHGSEHSHHVSPRAQIGPPYSLLLVDLPESNALSYGFGGDGGGGIVVYSGFLDEVLGESNVPWTEPASATSDSWLGKLLGNGSTSREERPRPTPEQTEKLATLLAHELSHLLLSHHLETLSSGTIFIPSVIGIVSDVVRVLLFPITMILGPFVNDAVANFTRAELDGVVRSGSICQSRKLEFEADLVSARILAHAGFDPRCAVKFWEGRRVEPVQEDAARGFPEPKPSPENPPTVLTPPSTVPGTFWTSRSSALGGTTGGYGDDSHPLDQARVLKLNQELSRWEREKAYAMGKMKLDSWARGACEASARGGGIWGQHKEKPKEMGSDGVDTTT